MSARADLAAALAAAVPGARVIGYASTPDNLPKDQPFLMVYRETVTPSPLQGCQVDALAIWCAVPQTNPATADDALDVLLDAVVVVLDGEPLPALAWTEAERGTLDGAWPSYKITATITTANQEG